MIKFGGKFGGIKPQCIELITGSPDRGTAFWGKLFKKERKKIPRIITVVLLWMTWESGNLPDHQGPIVV
jgi:hypothetical protein